MINSKTQQRINSCNSHKLHLTTHVPLWNAPIARTRGSVAAAASQHNTTLSPPPQPPQQQQQQQQPRAEGQRVHRLREAQEADRTSHHSPGSRQPGRNSDTTAASNNVVPFPGLRSKSTPQPRKAPGTATTPQQHPAITPDAVGTVLQEEEQPTQHTSSSSSSSSGRSGGTCPFLRAVQPPLVDFPWWQRIWQVTQPYKFQSMILQDTLAAGGTMVQVNQALGFEGAYVPGTGPAVRAVLAGDSGAEPFSGPSLVPFFVNLVGEESLLVKSGQEHKSLRALLSPAFSPDAVGGYVPQVVELVERHLAAWAAAGDEGVKGLDALKLLTFEFIVQLTFGQRYSQSELHSLHTTYLQWVNGLPAWPWLNLPFTPYAAALRAREEMLQHFQGELDAARARIAAGEEVPGLLGGMLAAQDEQGNRLSDAEIKDNILLLLFAGHDTSGSTLTLALSNLQDHPHALQLLRQEQQQVVAKHGPQITAAALRDMPWAEAVIRETLRLDPVVQMLFRTALRDFELEGHTVPAGKQLLLPLKYLSAHDQRWEGQAGQLAPNVFNPGRLMTPEGQKAGDLAPFGFGARYCLGSGLAMVEMKAVLALLARHYSISVDNDTQWVHTISKMPKNGLPLVVKPLQE